MTQPTLRPWVIAVAIATALALVAPAPSAGAQDVGALVRVGENVRLGDDPRPARGRDRPGFAVNPADPNHIVAVDEDFIDGECNYHVSFDAGHTWTSGHLRGPAGFPSPPCVQFDTGGWSHHNGSVAFGSGQNVYTTYNAFRPGEGDSIIVNRSTDGGRTFAPGTVAVQGLPSGRTTNNRPNLAVVPRAAGDKVVVIYWGCETPGACSGTHRAHSVVSTNGGQTWAAPAFLNLPTDGPAPYPSPPAIGPDGTFYVTFRRSAGAPPRGTLVLATSRNDGATWTYEDVATVSGLNEQKIVADPRDGTLYVAYHATLTGSDQDIVFQRRPAGASAWSAPLRVNDDKPGTSVVNQRFPALSLAPNGRIDLLWHDRRHPYPGNDLDDFYYASSSDGGRTFSPNRRVTDRTINMDVGLDSRIGTWAFYWPAVAAVGTDTVLTAWPDSRDGNHDNDNQDIYMARLETPAAGPPPTRTVAEPDPASLAVALSKLAYPGGREVGTPSTTTTRAVVVNEADAASAEVGAVLARANLAPVLLSGAARLSVAAQDEVRRLGSVGAFLIGNETLLSAQVVADLKAAGVPEAGIVRIAGTDAPDTARLVAQRLDTRTDAQKTAGQPAFPSVVIANPATREAAAAAAMAAALRMPYLLVDNASVPQPTLDAIKALNIESSLVIGGPDAVSDAVLAKLPATTRLGGDDITATSAAVVRESVDRGQPVNIAYAGDLGHPVESAVLGAAVARLGGLLVLTPRADPAAARDVLGQAGLTSPVDRIVSARSARAAGGAVLGAAAAPAAAPSDRLPATGGPSSGAAVALLLASAAAARLGSRRAGRRRA